MAQQKIEVEVHGTGTHGSRSVDGNELMVRFLAKLPDPRLEEVKRPGDISAADKIIQEITRELLPTIGGITYVRANIRLNNVNNPSLVVATLGSGPGGHERLLVFKRYRTGWIEKDFSGEIECSDDLDTIVRLQATDPMWIVYCLYPDKCQVWLKLKLLLHKQDGAAITSLMQSKDGPVKGHTKRIAHTIEAAVTLLEKQLPQWCDDQICREADGK